MSEEQQSQGPGANELFGKYELVDRLGRGGMADVWRARVAGPQGFNRTVVLKRILPHLITDTRARELFEREARVVSRLSHANIVPVYEFGEIDGEYYLAMEYVEGRDLSALIRAGGASPQLAAVVVRDVCRALAYAHALRGDDGVPLRILHRDVSPSNIIVGYDGSVRLLDFGIAKAFSDPRDKRTVKGTIRGKFGYIAPEVFEGEQPDARADLFSIGVVLHETVSGKRLFRGASDIETLALVKRAQIPLLSSLHPAVPAALDTICLRALERDRERRYTSGSVMADDLDAVVHELRFGPTQLAELVEHLFPRETAFKWQDAHDSGPMTLVDQPALENDRASEVGIGQGLGTARVVEPDERATVQMDAGVVQALAAKNQARAHDQPAPPTAATVLGRGGQRGQAAGSATPPGSGTPLEAATVINQPVPPMPVPRKRAAKKKSSVGGLIFILVVLLIGALGTAAVLLKRRFPEKLAWLRLPTKTKTAPPVAVTPVATPVMPPGAFERSDLGATVKKPGSANAADDEDPPSELAAPSLKP